MFQMVRGFIERNRSSLLSLLMLALLLASVLAALAVSRQRSQPARQGVAILAYLRQGGLAGAMDHPVEAWFIAEDAQGKPVACLASAAACSQGVCRGLDLDLDLGGEAGALIRMQYWKAADDLSAIAYETRIQSGSGILLQQVDANVTASRLQIPAARQLNRRNQAETVRPDNLVPAGDMPTGTDGWRSWGARWLCTAFPRRSAACRACSRFEGPSWAWNGLRSSRRVPA